MISKLLSTAVQLYLRSQVRRVENLQVKVVGQNKQIFQGCIPQIFLSCTHAVYQGLHLSQVELNGTDIAFNLPEVVKRKPLRLLEPVYVQIHLSLDAADLQASLDSPLLQSGLEDLWQKILSAQTNSVAAQLDRLMVRWSRIAIADEQLHLFGTHQGVFGETKELCLSTGIGLANNHTLCLSPLEIIGVSLTEELQEELTIDLGTDVAIDELIIASEQIICSGKIKINN